MNTLCKWKLTLLCGVAVVNSTSAAAANVALPPADSPALRGPITTESVDSVLRSLAASGQRRPRWIVVSSPGGDVVAALRLAEFMHQRGLSIYVDGICASSCANYLFPAAKEKVLGAGALVGWHGSPASEHIDGLESLGAGQRQAFQKSRQEMIGRERRLYSDLGIDPRLLCAGDRTIEKLGALGWTMPIKSMAKFGLKGVASMGSSPIPLRVPHHAEPIVVLDPDPDCDRSYMPVATKNY